MYSRMTRWVPVLKVNILVLLLAGWHFWQKKDQLKPLHEIIELQILFDPAGRLRMCCLFVLPLMTESWTTSADCCVVHVSATELLHSGLDFSACVCTSFQQQHFGLFVSIFVFLFFFLMLQKDCERTERESSLRRMAFKSVKIESPFVDGRS